MEHVTNWKLIEIKCAKINVTTCNMFYINAFCLVYVCIDMLLSALNVCSSGVIRGVGGADRAGWHPLGGATRRKTILWANLERIVEKRGRTGKKRCGVTPSRGWHASESNKKAIVIMTAMSKKRSPGFSGKNRGVTPSVAAPGVTHPSDATGLLYAYRLFIAMCLIAVNLVVCIWFVIEARVSLKLPLNSVPFLSSFYDPLKLILLHENTYLSSKYKWLFRAGYIYWLLI